MQLMGLDILIDDELMSKTVEDWSNVRSPSRAKRRLRRGFAQKIAYKRVPKTELYRFGERVIMHSQTHKELLKRLYDSTVDSKALKEACANGQSQSSYSADDLSFRYRAEGAREESFDRGNIFRQDIIHATNLSWVYNPRPLG